MNRVIDKLFILISSLTNVFLSFSHRPKLAKDYKKKSDAYDYTNLGIIIQGGVGDAKFLIETIKIYGEKIFPGSKIIISTWSSESSSTLKKIKDLNMNVELITTNKPRNAGIGNINLQILSTSKAVLWAKKNNINYLMKTRSDQRVFATNTYQFLLSMLELFPSQSKKQRHRLIGISLNTFRNRLYGISDMFMFGHTHDMLKYWTPDLDKRKKINDNKIKTQLQYSKMKICEVYLMTKYLEAINYSIKWTIADSLEVYKKYFCIIDQSTIDLFWNKYTLQEDRWKNYDDNNDFTEIKFINWINLKENK